MRMRNWLGAAVAAGVTAALVAGPGAVAEHQPADKVSASGSTTEIAGPQEEITIMSETVRTSTPSDLILGVTAECALVTNVTTVGNDDQEAIGDVKVWVEIDGEPVPISADDTEDGQVTFCNRAYRRKTSLFNDEDATIETFFRTRAANGFNWLALNVGNGVHTIEVKATLDEEATSGAQAEAVIGNRTLIVEPTKAANDEVVTELG